MLTQRDLQQAIYDRAEHLKDEEIFLSPIYEHHLTEMGHGITRLNMEGKTHMKRGLPFLAETDGKETYIGYDSKQAASLTRTKRHFYYEGLNLHENGHKLFTDFKLMEKAEEQLMAGTLYPMPKDNEYRLETLEYLNDPGTDKALLRPIYHNLDNIIEDGFIDRASCAEAPGYAPMLSFVNEVDSIGDIKTIDEMRAIGLDDVTIFTNMILIYCVHGVRSYDEADKENEMNKDIIESFETLYPILSNAVYEVKPLERKRMVNEAFCHVVHFLIAIEKKENEPDKSSDDSSKESTENDDSKTESEAPVDDEVDAEIDDEYYPDDEGEKPSKRRIILESLADSMQTTERSSHENMDSPKEETIALLQKAFESDREFGTSSAETIDDTSSSEFESITMEIAGEAVFEDMEARIKKELKDIIKEMDKSPFDGSVGCKVKRDYPSPEALSEYEIYCKELDDIVRKLTRTYEKEISDRQIGDTMNHLYAGKRLDTNHLYSDDKRIFEQILLPGDAPDIAIGILVDGSGSMFWGEPESKMSVAKKCAYITYSFCRRLNIPCFVIGHTTEGNNVVINSVADENSLDSKDKYRIFNLKAAYDNRDGYALRFCLKKLEKINRKYRLMFVISDGAPWHGSYQMLEGQKDCQEAVHKALKKGIYTIAAGLGIDAEGVQKVYQEGRSERDCATFLDITDLERMPTAFIKIIKKQLRRSA